MEFTVPQFIEKEAKIVGPLTFKQFVFVGVAAAFCIFLYFATPFYMFIAGTIFFLGGAMALAFIKINKIPLPVYIKNLLYFIFKPKIYLWKRKNIQPRLISVKKEEEIAEEMPEGSSFGTTEKSRLNKLSVRLETKQK